MNISGYLPQIIAVTLMLAGVPVFIEIYKITSNIGTSLLITVLYELLVLIGGFFTKVWQRLEGRWTERLADRIDIILQTLFSGYRRRYLEYISYQHRFFDVKGLLTQGPYNLELEKVFVQLSVDPTPIHETSANPLQSLPEYLRSGSHTIWKYLNAVGMKNHDLVILGAPGSGKTTLLKHIALTLAIPASHRRRIGVPQLLPILLFLRDHASDIADNSDIKLPKLIRDQFERRQAPVPPEEWLERRLEQGNCLIMFDGLDEVADVTVRKKVINWVEQCMSAFNKNRFILSSRPHGYKTNPLSGVTLLQVKPFTSSQVKQFVHNWYTANEIMSSQRDDPGVRADARLGAEDLLRRIIDTPTLSELAVNPLLLTMIATIHRYRSSLPGRRVELYAEICEVFLGKRHEARGVISDLTPAQKQRVLQPLAYYLMQKNTRGINQAEIQPVLVDHLRAVSPTTNSDEFIKDIENNSGLLVERESGEYTFSHQTFQEYLASVHILENGLEKELVDKVDQSWWHETIRLYCAQADASNIIRACLDARTVLTMGLAIESMNEAREVNMEVRNQYEEVIERGVESADTELRRVIAEAYLNTRLNRTNVPH